MILTLIVTDKNGLQLKKERIDVSQNQLKRITAPEFNGEVAYRTKKHGKAIVELADGTQIEYRLFKGYVEFLEYWNSKAKKLTDEEAEQIVATLKGAGYTDEQAAEFLSKPIAEINKEIEQIESQNGAVASP
jgi:esterase/lipase